MSNESMSSGDNVNISPSLRVGSNGGGQPPAIAFSCKDHGGDAGSIAPTLRAMGHNGSHANAGGQVAVAFSITPSNSNKDYNARQASKSQALTAGGNRPSARGGDLAAFAQNQRDEIRAMDVAGALAGEPGMKQQTFIASTAVRRLTPRECERLQGFPDDYTLIPYRGRMMADGSRYKMLGNSMAVPVMAWLGQRIQLVDSILGNDQTPQAHTSEDRTQSLPASDEPARARTAC
jgi:DNA (cytosine-5)-methyltransferase 1